MLVEGVELICVTSVKKLARTEIEDRRVQQDKCEFKKCICNQSDYCLSSEMGGNLGNKCIYSH